MIRKLSVLILVFSLSLACASFIGFFKPPARASNSDEGGGATIQDSSRQLPQTSQNMYSRVVHEPSPQSEQRYVRSIREWLDTLPAFQRERARAILKDAHPAMHALRKAISEKKGELVSLSFDRNTPPDTLPRLGQELQVLRDELKSRLKDVERRLKMDAGVVMGPLDGDGFWLSTPEKEVKSTPETGFGKGAQRASKN